MSESEMPQSLKDKLIYSSRFLDEYRRPDGTVYRVKSRNVETIAAARNSNHRTQHRVVKIHLKRYVEM